MPETKPVLLQLNPFAPYLESELPKRFEIVRWFALDAAAQQAWLADHAASVRAVAAGGHVGCPDPLMESLPNLGIVTINGVGFDKVDLDLARSRGVRVTTTPGMLTEDVADLGVGLIIALLRALPAADAHVRAGKWPSGDRPLGQKVSGRRFGIVGLGHIGAAVARRLEAFGPIAYTDPVEKDVPYAFHADVTALAAASDVLVVACSANAATYRLIGAEVLTALGPQGYLINISRGSVVDEAALIDALEAGRIAGAALDVVEDEPNVPEPLRTSDRAVITPHIASATVQTRTAMADCVLANLDAFLAGTPLPSPVA